MIITDDDIQEVEQIVERIRLNDDIEDEHLRNVGRDSVLLASRPHLLMALGYDEFRALKGSLENEPEQNRIKDLYGLKQYLPVYRHESVYRDAASGAWYWYEGMDPKMLHLTGPTAEPDRYVPVDQWLNILHKIHKDPDHQNRTLWLPSIWTPQVQEKQSLLLGDAVGAIIRAVHIEKTKIKDIPWRQLEELVAELLRARGLQVYVTPRSNDGGRDIIARGELIPGEPALLAVEVKQKPVVGLADVQRALRANEDFPALMVATAGRFSAGVIKEKNRDRNYLRLYLKDGIALTQWIESYMHTQGSGFGSRPNLTKG
jgi:hypothetical protein